MVTSPSSRGCRRSSTGSSARSTQLAEIGSPSSAGLPPLTAAVAQLATGWGALAADGSAVDRAVAAVGAEGPWLREHLDDLARWSEPAASAAEGMHLSHGDLRADNILLDERELWIVDWPWATGGGAAWFDLLTILPSVAMQGGGEPASLFWSHPNAAGADREAVHSVLAAVTGYFLEQAVQPAPLGITNLRPFQLAQGLEALRWLRAW